MHKFCVALPLAVALLIAVAGCGGSGSGQPGAPAPPPPSQGSNVWNQGNLRVETQAIGDLKTVPFGSSLGLTFGGIGFYGTLIRRLEYRPLPGRIAFTRTVSGVAQVFVADPDGGREKQLTSGSTPCTNPRISPDGTQIVYEANGRIRVMNIDGSGDHMLLNFTTTDNCYPSWDRDGNILFVGKSSGQWDIWILTHQGWLNRLTNTTDAEMTPASSPDGSRIVFSRLGAPDSEIWIMRSDGSNEVQLTSNTADDVQPCWSPDAGWIAFASLRDGNYEIYKMQPDGSNPTRLTNNAAMDLSPVWSPDGSRIMWLREGDLWEMNADGSNQHLVKADLADWSVSLDWWGPTSDRYRVFIGPSGSDFGGANPPFGTSRNSAIVTFGTSGLGGCVTVGSDAGMPTITYIGNAGGPMVVEVRAQAGRPGVNRVLEDRGPGVPIGLYDMPDDDPGSGKAYPQAVLLAFAAETGRLMAVMGVRVTAAGTARAAGGTPLLEQRGGQLVVRAPICAVFTPDNPSRNLAPSGASAVVLCSRTGRVLEIK